MKHTHIFRVVPERPRSFLQRIFRQYEKENAIIEFNNLLATRPAKDVSFMQVLDIGKRYKVNLQREFERNMDEFYAAYLKHCLSDKKLDNSEIAELKHLKSVLGLTEAKVALIHETLAGAIYKNSMSEALEDAHISAEEKEFLNRLKSELQLPEELAERISSEMKKAYLDPALDTITADGRLSPDEEQELLQLSKNLDMPFTQKDRAELRKMKLQWAAENLPLTPIDAGIKLQKDENCYYRGSAGWYEAGSGRNAFSWKLVAEGELFLTNKRVFLSGLSSNKNLPFTQILYIEAEQQGIVLHKMKGKNPLIKVHGGSEEAKILLKRLLNGSL